MKQRLKARLVLAALLFLGAGISAIGIFVFIRPEHYSNPGIQASAILVGLLTGGSLMSLVAWDIERTKNMPIGEWLRYKR